MRRVADLCEEAADRTAGAFSAWLPRDAGPVFDDSGTAFDPTGLVKGWSVEEAFHHLLADLGELGPHDALLSAGGDVVVASERTDTPDWVIAVEDPADRTQRLTSVTLRRGAVATSGTAARGAHVIDPRTGVPATRLLSASVVGPSLLWSDVFATAVLARGGDAPWFEALRTDYACLVVPAEGTVRRAASTAGPSPGAHQHRPGW